MENATMCVSVILCRNNFNFMYNIIAMLEVDIKRERSIEIILIIFHDNTFEIAIK